MPTPKVLDIKSLRRMLAKFDEDIECMKELNPNASRSGTAASVIRTGLRAYYKLLEEKRGEPSSLKLMTGFVDLPLVRPRPHPQPQVHRLLPHLLCILTFMRVMLQLRVRLAVQCQLIVLLPLTRGSSLFVIFPPPSDYTVVLRYSQLSKFTLYNFTVVIYS